MDLHSTLNSVKSYLPPDIDMKQYHREHKKNDTAMKYRRTEKYREYRRKLSLNKYHKKALFLNELKCYNV